jgi:hypothetical protein
LSGDAAILGGISFFSLHQALGLSAFIEVGIEKC